MISDFEDMWRTENCSRFQRGLSLFYGFTPRDGARRDDIDA